MRILHVNKFLYRRGGAEAYALDLAELQRERGHEVELFGMRHPENLPQKLEPTFPGYVEFDPPPAGPVARARLFGRMVHSTSARDGMAQAIERFRPDVVHLHNIYHQLSPSVLKPLQAAGIPAVMTLHDYKLACPSYSMLDGSGRVCNACVSGGLRNAVLRRCGGSAAAGAAAALEVAIHRNTDAYGHVQRFLCPSQFLADTMRDAGIYPGRMRVQNNFVDARGLPERTGPGTSVVFVGRLSHEKGVDLLVRAMKFLPDTVTLEIAGTGPRESELRRLAADGIGEGRVVFHGRLGREQVGSLLASAGVVAVPSRWYENQPIAVLEAFACGVPVVAARYGGLVELIQPGVNGELVAPDDPEALADGLGCVLADTRRNAEMGRAARALAVSAYSPSAHVVSVEGHYRELVEQSSRNWRPGGSASGYSHGRS